MKEGENMNSISIEYTPNNVVLTLDRDEFAENFLKSFIKRWEAEKLAQRAEIDESILEIADEINREWWERNKHHFLDS